MENYILSAFQIWIIIGILFVIIEIFTPTMFFLNLALGCFFACVLAFFSSSVLLQVFAFAFVSLINIYFLMPYLKRSVKTSEKTGIEDKYIGKTAKVIEKIDGENLGAITIYGERWFARNCEGKTIEVGENVVLRNLEDSVFWVEREEKEGG